MSAWQFWIDRGGTFTDIVARGPDGGLLSRKLLSDSPEHYRDAALYGIRQILQSAADASARIDSVKMGTTVGTNALLERKGEAVALLINRGFKDCLRIAYQNRPDIFALHIRRPEPLYQKVLEIDARVDAEGEVLRALNRAQAREQLLAIYEQGMRAVAIVMMHAWRYPQHELELAEIAREIGFRQISLSHRVSPLPKIVGRGDTAVLDAYLSPLLRRYVDEIGHGLAGLDPSARLLFMQSNGGLVRADEFRGKDSILSGPAGGMIGAVEVAKQAGLSKIIAFDMGGTSTDVAHYAGELERTLDTELAGARIRAPVLDIHTVAAGGGSILYFDGFRYRVGPESAGANPGPACYRRGGPLTVTDANLLLGKLPYFPAVFGANADLPPDAERVRQLFRELAMRIKAATGDSRDIEQVAEGFLSIAIENMAEAIKKISVQKGYHLAEYALCCYGAAGGQHACLLAESLGMDSVLLHPLAGVLSAYGMGLADFRVLEQQAVERCLDDIDTGGLTGQLAQLELRARAALMAQGLKDAQIDCPWRLVLRYQGSDSALTLDFTDAESIRGRFEALHRRQFGFCYERRPLLLAALQVEAIGRETRPAPAPGIFTGQNSATPESVTRMFSRNAWHDTPVYRRGNLAARADISGPAIVVEETSTIVIEPGWRAHLRANGDLLLTRVETSNGLQIVSTQRDPVLLEIFNRRFMSVAEQMGFVLQNTAHSVNIKERLDFSCALFDAGGQLIANAPHIPVHLGSMGESVKALIEQKGEDFQPGDAYLTNSPYAGGTHLPDITVVTPVFAEDGGPLLFFVASRGHHADIGGISPGSMPADSRHIDDEGVISGGLQILKQGQFQERAVRQWLASNPNPARNPEQNLADLQAQIAANQKGRLELSAMVAAYSLPVVMAYMRHVREHAEACVRTLLTGLTAGRFEYEMDQGAKIVVAIEVDRQRQAARIDFSGSSAQLPGNFNAPAAVCRAAVLYVFRSLLQDDIPLNAGCLQPLEIVIPPGCLLNPTYPAAVAAGNVETSQYIVDALYGALGVLAASQGSMNNFSFGNARLQYYETICGGAGAGDGFNGADAVHTHMTNSRITDPEILEARFPVLLREFSIRPGSGGGGRYRGGDGVIRRIEFRQPMRAVIVSSHRRLAPFGLKGGKAGALGVNRWLRRGGGETLLPACAEIQVAAGDSIVIETPGGGGYGEG
ncbi:hydantoinase B/oxoprolinase family protein [Methylomonas sp. SURF-2]|uniref:Hydantoinase B/oxoprolinase family protein n=1 Tax=Methylomonas subterranea TaxID=2952225 RepID=A0ABT1TCH0_9GAMM|nr:hydantoinase B/oxoprolinase family protein [Methylomonas sp. SURF-2]MCQ8102963.1 hydantoinase B/oxoprolinase family protein [Methylomonas sp. SURF-2]